MESVITSWTCAWITFQRDTKYMNVIKSKPHVNVDLGEHFYFLFSNIRKILGIVFMGIMPSSHGESQNCAFSPPPTQIDIEITKGSLSHCKGCLIHHVCLQSSITLSECGSQIFRERECQELRISLGVTVFLNWDFPCRTSWCHNLNLSFIHGDVLAAAGHNHNICLFS